MPRKKKKIGMRRPKKVKPAKTRKLGAKKAKKRTGAKAAKTKKPKTKRAVRKRAEKKITARKVKPKKAKAKKAKAKKVLRRRAVKKRQKLVKQGKPGKQPLKRSVLDKLKAKAEDAAAIKARRIKSKIKSRELQKLRQELLLERQRLVQQLESLGNQSLAAEAKGGHNGVPGYSIHMAEYASDSQAMDTALGIRTMEEERLVQIEEALRRIDEGNYGICEACGKAINMERLLAIPSAQFCIQCKKAIEMGKV